MSDATSFRERPWLTSLLVGFLAWAFSIFLYSPRLSLYLLPTSGLTRRDDLLSQCLDPFTRSLDEPLLYYRVVQPIIAHAFGWCGSRTEWLALLGSPGIAYIALIVSLGCTCWALSRRFSASLAILTTFALATTQVAQWTNLYWGHPDSLSLLPAAVMLCTRKFWVFVAASTIGLLNDERFLLALPFIFLWWWAEEKRPLAFLKACRWNLGAIAVALALAFLVRTALLYGWIGPGIDYKWGSTFSGYASRLLEPSTWPGLALMIAMSFRWLWLIPLYALLLSLRRGLETSDFAYWASVIIVVLASFAFSADVSRNIAFAFPLIPVSLVFLCREHNVHEHKLRISLGVILGLNIVTPAATFFELPSSINPLSWGSIYLPLPVNLWRWLSLRGQG